MVHKSDPELRTSNNVAAQQRAITLSPARDIATGRSGPLTLSPTQSKQSIVTLHFTHLRNFLSQASAGHVVTTSNRRLAPIFAMPQNALKRQCYSLRSRIRHNVKAAFGEDWDSLETWYKPTVVQDASNTEWTALVKQQDSVRERIEAIKKRSTVPSKKLHIIRTLRNEFPEIASEFPAPVDPEPGTESKMSKAAVETLLPLSSSLPSYETARSTGQLKTLDQSHFSLNEPPVPSTVKQPSSKSIDRRQIKRARRETVDDDEGDEDSDESTYGKDNDFDPKQERGERAATRCEQKRNDDSVTKPPKDNLTEEQLLRQNEELKAKFRLDQIRIFKQIAIIKNEKQEHWDLVVEELDIKMKRDKDKLKKKILGIGQN